MRKLDKFMRQGVYNKVFPGGVLLIMKEGRTLFFEAYGYANMFSKRKMTRDTVFDLASLTKPLGTTLALMLLVQQGKLDIEQDIESFLPEFGHTDKGKIKVRHLLTHNSGLPDWRPYYRHLREISHDRRRPALRDFLVNEPLICATGGNVVYSDLGFMILAWIIERISGKRLDCFAEKNIYTPLGLEALFFTDIRVGPRKGGYAATEQCPWRNMVLEGLVHDDNAYAAGGIEGHAGLFGTAGAIGSLLSELMGNFHGHVSEGILDGNLLNIFFRRQKGTDRALGFDMPSPHDSACGRYFSERTVGHLGFTGTSFWMDMERSLIVILLTNRVHPSRDNFRIKDFRPELHDLAMETFGG